MNNGWQVKKLGDVLQKTETVNPTNSPDKEFEYVDVSSVSNSTFSIQNTTTLKGANAPSRARKLIKTGDILFATVRPTLKRICIVPPELNGQVCSTGYFVLRPKSDISNSFIFYYLFTDDFMEAMEKAQKGASYPAVTDKEVKEQAILIAPLHEQLRIVAVLDEAFAGITTATDNAKKNLQNARELFESYLQSIFTKKGDRWVEKKFGTVCHFVRGPFGGSLTKSCFKPTGYAVYEQQHAIYDQFDEIRYFIDEVKFNEMQRFELKAGDLIMSCSGTMGKVAIVPDGIQKGIINQALLKLSPNKDLLVQFLRYWMRSQSFQAQNEKYSMGAAIKNVASVAVLKQIDVPIPPLTEQQCIVAQLDTLATQTKRLEAIYHQKLDNLAALKQSILQKAFAGELHTDKLAA